MYKIDITVVEEDLGVNFLMAKVFAKLHTLQQKHTFAVSFKNHTKKGVGNVVSVVASEDVLAEMKVKRVLQGLDEYLHISKPKIASDVTYFKRVNSDKGVERLKRRCIKRKGVTHEVADEMYKDYKQKHCKSPYLIVDSSSTGQKFSLFVEPCADTGKYNNYGLCI
ncbi:CRISPR-associated protein [Vibrio phage 1.161.O._10N.261.48.C5]|nr:CRISPR-associated protein [Vibrio phage 1.161.O._10N.261.48.C5]